MNRRRTISKHETNIDYTTLTNCIIVVNITFVSLSSIIGNFDTKFDQSKSWSIKLIY